MCEIYNITKNDCITILKKHLQTTNFELLEFEEESLSGKVVGIMSGHYQLRTKCKIQNEIVYNNFFVKRMQSPYNIQTQFIEEQGAYEKENFAYGHLKKLYEQEEKYSCDFMANCYLSVKEELFVFQDVTEEGFSVHKCKSDLDTTHLKLVLDAIAKFHAGSIIHEHKKSLETGKEFRMIDDYSHFLKDPNYRRNENYIGDRFYKTCVKAVLSLIDIVPYYKNNNIEIKNKFLINVDRVYDLVKPSTNFCNVICHGDLWNSNLLFKYDKNNEPKECKIIDFQALRYTVPTHDYLFIIHTNNFNSDKNDNVLSKFYYECLEKYLVQSNIDIDKYITYDQFLASIDYVYPLIIVQNACFVNLCVARFNEDILKDENLFFKCMYEDRSEWCIEEYKNNDLFRSIIDQSLKDLNKL